MSKLFLNFFLLAVMIFILKGPFEWLVLNSVWSGSSSDCQMHTGACLAFVRDKMDLILWGTFPGDKRILLCGYFLSFFASLFFFFQSRRKIEVKFGVLLFSFVLESFFLWPVSISKWNGLLLVLYVFKGSYLVAFPLGLFLAVVRRYGKGFWRMGSIGLIEFVRGMPLIGLLFMASVMLPLFLPVGWEIPKIIRLFGAYILFVSATLAEIFRGGLEQVGKGQMDAANSLGLRWPTTLMKIILPQAVMPMMVPCVNVGITLFKDTALMGIVSMMDLTMTSKMALKDLDWGGYVTESYLFITLVYFFFCFLLSYLGNCLRKRAVIH